MNDLAWLLGPHELDLAGALELQAFWALAKERPEFTARSLFPDRPRGYKRATQGLGEYAINKAIATELRLRGEVEKAIVYEEIGEAIYSLLPKYAQW